MGLSSSQARLLSITARITDNEYKSQQIANQRIKLSDISNNARKEYNDALNSNTFVYVAYNNYGGYVQTSLSPAALYEYQPSKNQYALTNTAGKVLVDNKDAKNFRETDTLAEFLKRYDCLDNVSQAENYVEQIKVPYEAPNDAHKAWEEECAAIDALKEKDKEAVENWVDTGKPVWDDEVEREKYTTRTHVFDWQYEESGESKSLYEMFREASQGCYGHALRDGYNPKENCYMHVLVHMLDLSISPSNNPIGYPKSFTTTIGTNVSISESDITGNWINNGYDDKYNKICDSFTPYMVPVSDVIRDGYDPKDGSPVQTLMAYDHPSSELDLSTAKEWEKLISDYYMQSININDTSNDALLKRLISNYKPNPSGNPIKKTLREKTIDMLYLITNLEELVSDDSATQEIEYITYYNEVLKPLIQTFQEDMQVSLQGYNMVDKGYDIVDFKEDEYNQAKEKFEEDLANYTPTPPVFDENDPKYAYPEEPPKTVLKERTEEVTKSVINETLTIIDPEKAQWYTNLWYRMNGMDEPERIYKNVEDVVNDRQEEQTYTEYLLKLFDIKKNTFTTCYQELPANLASSKDWFNNALAQGWVTLQKAGVSRTTAKDKFKWSDIIYSNASDITLTQDDNAIAKAEAKYTQALREVNSKDKVFENKIRKLDTEHNALQTEYNSVKAAIDKNVERSFKVFQG